jgi:hypothetical protein
MAFGQEKAWDSTGYSGVEVTLTADSVTPDSLNADAKAWGWPNPTTWEQLLRTTVSTALNKVGLTPRPSHPRKLVVAAHFSSITFLSLGTPTNPGISPGYIRVALEGELAVVENNQRIDALPFRAARNVFTPGPQLLASLFNHAVADAISRLPSKGIDGLRIGQYIWSLRRVLPQEHQIKQQIGNPKSELKRFLALEQPGPTLWELLLRTKMQTSVALVLDSMISTKDGLVTPSALAAARALRNAAGDPDVRTAVEPHRVKIEAMIKQITESLPLNDAEETEFTASPAVIRILEPTLSCRRATPNRTSRRLEPMRYSGSISRNIFVVFGATSLSFRQIIPRRISTSSGSTQTQWQQPYRRGRLLTPVRRCSRSRCSRNGQVRTTRPNHQMEPTRPWSCAIMSPWRAAHLERWAAWSSWRWLSFQQLPEGEALCRFTKLAQNVEGLVTTSVQPVHVRPAVQVAQST